MTTFAKCLLGLGLAYLALRYDSFLCGLGAVCCVLSVCEEDGK